MKVSNLYLNVLTAICYPFILVFAFIFIFTLYPLALLIYFPDGTEVGTSFYEFKEEFIERWCSPKKFLTAIWQISKEHTRDTIQALKVSWPIFIAFLIIYLLSLVVSSIFI